MGKPPLSTFRGHLKQTSSRDYDPKFRPLLDPLFPHFFESIGSWEDHPETIRTWREGLPSHVSMEFLDYQVPRRFGGYDLPRGRYFTVCEDSTGNDHGTLVHELRAYRNPARSGMIDVLDFGLGNNTLLMGTREVCIPRSQHWGVLIDDCDRVAGLLDGVPHELLLHSDGSTKILVKVPYRVSNACCERTIDLRSAEARQWFFEYFSKPNPSWIWPQQLVEDGVISKQSLKNLEFPPTTIVSEFERHDGMAAVPTSFFEMLPTLLNPVRGGGDHAWGGTTLTAIGASLEALAVQGFIFPSARGDARVLFDNGTMVSFAGWCFVDLSESPNRSRKAVVDPSPWSWHWLPTGATLVAAQEGTPPAGSFAISGMVEGSRREYLFKVECLAAARARLGATSPEFEALLLGQYSIRWLRSALIPALHRAIDELKVACGLTLRRGEEWIAGKYHWLFNTMLSGDKQVNILEELKTLAEKLAGTVTDKQQREIVLVGMELELIRLQVQIFRRMSMTSLPEELATRRLVAISLPQAGASTVTKLATLVGKVGAPLDECDHVGEAVGSLLEEHFGASASTCSPSSSAGATRAPA